MLKEAVVEVFFAQFVFPNSYDGPSPFLQRFCCEYVPVKILFDFVDPVVVIFQGDSAMQGAAVPETAVHKYGQPLFQKNKVGVPLDLVLPSPARYVARFENGDRP
jgi:hypothetical protein